MTLAIAAPAFGQESNVDSLPMAQRRLTGAMKSLDQAKAQVKKEETRVKDSEESLTRLQRKVEEEKNRLEQARKQLAEAQASAALSQNQYDQSNGEIQRLYRERQPSPSKP
ncbi:MAG: hypothetical protein ABI612_01820 [Betaproteobacteria bacterium]